MLFLFYIGFTNAILHNLFTTTKCCFCWEFSIYKMGFPKLYLEIIEKLLSIRLRTFNLSSTPDLINVKFDKDY